MLSIPKERDSHNLKFDLEKRRQDKLQKNQLVTQRQVSTLLSQQSIINAVKDRLPEIQLARITTNIKPHVILCHRVEGLSALIRSAESNGDLEGFRICRLAPRVSHLLFADDCFLFFQAEERQAIMMKQILTQYEEASGQAISLPKSEIFYSRNVAEPLHQSITNILGVRAVLGTGKYLGLPSMVGRSKKATFSFIKDRVWQKINSWSSKCLSKAGREVMIKSVLQSIPSYIMSIFRLPNQLLDEIEKMMNTFWWGHGGSNNKGFSNNKGLNWLSWEKLSVHKNDGDMGFKDLAAFNVAMLGARWKIGNGFNIPIVSEPWIGSGLSIPPVGDDMIALQSYSVGHLIDQEGKVWNEPLIHQFFVEDMATNILNTPLHHQVLTDKLIWKAEKNGLYSVKSAYRICIKEVINNDHLCKPGYWSGIWKLKVPPKVKNLIWRICRDCFPTRVKLRSRGVTCPSECVICEDPHEDSYHILFHCPRSIDIWQTTNLWHLISPALHQFDNAPDIIFNLLHNLSAAQIENIVTIMWSIWKARNLKLWQQVSNSFTAILERAKHLLDGWRKANRKRVPIMSDNQALLPSASNSSNNTNIRWRKPESGRYKCNVDASFPTMINKVGFGMCIRDSDENHVRSKTMWFNPTCSVDVGEALTLHHAIRWIHELQLLNVDFEVD
ncbi:uncharacterized protein [Medicago truncatula]|uniref:uncharacterized protein n=1 Tax=Medicago truncatula TaxID=3880 RepID=UPI0019670955|nr:uncharacterized protein LOC112420019 [Medicago truncatula]